MDFRMQSQLGPRVMIGGRERDYFSGTGYLGLHNHPRILQAAVDAIQSYGMATATSRGGYGEHALYDALEGEACRFFGSERALYYPSGYMSGIILAQGLCDRYERILIDEWAHYSLWDAARATGKPLASFAHAQPDALAEVLRRELKAGERPLVMSDGIFPISGEIAPLPAYQQILENYPGAWLCLDDAHATGVLGEHGRGTFEHFGVQGTGQVAGHTLSKGIGGYGGLIAGTKDWIEELEHNCRLYVGSSPPPLPVAAAARQALALAGDGLRRRALWENVAYLRAGLRRLGWPLEETPVPILCLRARAGVDLGRLKDGLFARDVCVAHVRNYSSTPAGGALRVAVFASHTREQMDRLLAALEGLL